MQQVPISLPSDRLGPEWDGYHLELLGLTRHVDLDGIYMTASAEAGGPSIRLRDTLGSLQLDLQLWHQRAYRRDRPLVAELRWWPGQETVQNFFRVTVSSTEELSQRELRDARRALQLLHQVAPTLTSGGRPRLEDTPSTAELELAREAERLKRYNPAWTWLRIAHHIGLVEAVEDEGRSGDPERAARARLERWRKRLREVEK